MVYVYLLPGQPVRLAPLNRPGQGEGASLRGRMPETVGENIMNTTGGAPTRATDETVISVPEGGGTHAAYSGEHMVSVPGTKSRSAVAPMKQKREFHVFGQSSFALVWGKF